VVPFIGRANLGQDDCSQAAIVHLHDGAKIRSFSGYKSRAESWRCTRVPWRVGRREVGLSLLESSRLLIFTSYPSRHSSSTCPRQSVWDV